MCAVGQKKDEQSVRGRYKRQVAIDQVKSRNIRTNHFITPVSLYMFNTTSVQEQVSRVFRLRRNDDEEEEEEEIWSNPSMSNEMILPDETYLIDGKPKGDLSYDPTIHDSSSLSKNGR